MAQQSFIWTALPNDYSEDHRSLRISIMVSPRLDAFGAWTAQGFLVAGGTDSSAANLDDAYVYDPAQGWTGGYATRSDSGAVYLNAEFTVLEGPYSRRKIFTLIGLYSPKGRSGRTWAAP